MQNTSPETIFLAQKTQTPSDLLTRKQAASYLGIAPSTLAIWASVKRYALPYVKVGCLVKYRRADLDDFIARRSVSCHPANREGV
jgi:excisionase family DNA binding protein